MAIFTDGPASAVLPWKLTTHIVESPFHWQWSVRRQWCWWKNEQRSCYSWAIMLQSSCIQSRRTNIQLCTFRSNYKLQGVKICTINPGLQIVGGGTWESTSPPIPLLYRPDPQCTRTVVAQISTIITQVPHPNFNPQRRHRNKCMWHHWTLLENQVHKQS